MKTADAAQVEETPGLESWLTVMLGFANEGREAPSGSATDKSDQVDVAYNEFCERQAAGEDVDPEEFLAEHSHIRSSLGRLMRAHAFLDENPQMVGERPPPQWPRMGDFFLGFRLVRELGRGAFARVFLATEPALGDREVAVKVSTGGGAEAHTIGRIGTHPGIVPVYSVQEEMGTGLSAVCMPYLGGATLTDVLDHLNAHPGVPLSAATILHSLAARAKLDESPVASPLRNLSYVDGIRQIGMHLAEALQFIHDRNVCHRDLKPSNVLMTAAGQPMLLDFNLSADLQTAESGICGTVPYMPPEQLAVIANQKQADLAGLDARSDLYALGVMLYELLSGKHPFGPLPVKLTIEDTRQLLARQTQLLTPLRELNPAVDSQLARLVEQCLAFDKTKRPARAADVAAVLAQKKSVLERGGRWISRHRWVTAAAAVLLLSVGAGTAAVIVNKEPADARHWRLGQLAYRERNCESAVGHFNKFLEMQPNNVDALVARGRAFLQLGEKEERYYRQALADFEIADKSRPDDARILAFLGYSMQRLKHDVLSQHFLERALDNGLESAELYNDLGYFYMTGKANWKKARDFIDKAIELNPKLEAAYHNRAIIAFQAVLGSPDWKKPTTEAQAKQYLRILNDAKKDLQMAFKVGVPSMELHRNAALVLATSSRYQPSDAADALKNLESAVSLGLDPNGFSENRVLDPLKGDQHYQKLLALHGTGQPLPPTTRIVDPIRD